jgi:lipopolysaccharide/colanic/teichoic acid biosynthesis glycosyltransferase
LPDEYFHSSGLTLLSHEPHAFSPPLRLQVSRWCDSRTKRCFDLVFASIVLAALLPMLILIAALIRVTSRGPAIFRQKRVGQHGVEFTIFKFRTMHHAVEGSLRSSHGDHRITRLGRILRRYKLDELPQLANVCMGDMSLVGPRPKLYGHHSLETRFRPGLTGAATIAFSREERLLHAIPTEELEEYHRRHITPRKLELDLQYMAGATFTSDLELLWRTLRGTGRYLHLSELHGMQENARPTLVSSRERRDLPLQRARTARRSRG